MTLLIALWTSLAVGSLCDRPLVQYSLLRDGFAIVDLPGDSSPPTGASAFFGEGRRREFHLWTQTEAHRHWPEAGPLGSWGERILSAQLGVPAHWDHLVVVREPEGFTKSHVHTDPSMATLVVEVEGPAEAGTLAVPYSAVVTGPWWRYGFTHQKARRADRRTRRWFGEWVNRSDMIEAKPQVQGVFVLGHLARAVLGPDAPVGFHAAPFGRRSADRYLAVYAYELSRSPLTPRGPQVPGASGHRAETPAQD